ncbi:MAG: hypothetical protein ACREX9_23015 [Gammaproteobacteria bacterium]
MLERSLRGPAVDTGGAQSHRDLREVLHVYLEKTRFVVVEGLGGRLLLLFLKAQGLDVGEAVTAQTAIEPERDVEGLRNSLASDDGKIVEGQQQALAQHDLEDTRSRRQILLYAPL